jgi:cell division protein FtsB
MARRRKKKKGDALSQWQEFFSDKDGEGKGPPSSGEPTPVPRNEDEFPTEDEVLDEPLTPPSEEPEEDLSETGDEEVEEEVEGEVEGEVEEDEGEEDFVEHPKGEEAYWKEEKPADDVPISQWEKSLTDASKDDLEDDDDEEEEVLPEEDDDFAWPSVDDVEAAEASHASDAEATPEPTDSSPEAEMAAGETEETAGQDDGPERSTNMEEENMEEAPQEDAPQADTGQLDGIQGDIESVVNELSDLRSRHAQEVLQGLGQAGEILEAQHRQIMDLLRTNEGQAREARTTFASVEKRSDIKSELETQLTELRSINEQLKTTGDRLSADRDKFTADRDQATEENTRMKGESQSLREQIERLDTERTDLEAETADLDKQRNVLEEDVRRLTRLKEEYLANIARFREEG